VRLKYVNFAMRIDNDGEGGIIALMRLLGVKKRQRPIIIAVGLFGAALIYGDGAITPAISVLSALEGMEQVTPTLKTYVLPAATLILLALFAVQPFGTRTIGRAFGPVMLVWFVVTAALGCWKVHGPALWSLVESISSAVRCFLVASARKPRPAINISTMNALMARIVHNKAKPKRANNMGTVAEARNAPTNSRNAAPQVAVAPKVPSTTAVSSTTDRRRRWANWAARSLVSGFASSFSFAEIRST
jgi:hypothetical protein